MLHYIKAHMTVNNKYNNEIFDGDFLGTVSQSCYSLSGDPKRLNINVKLQINLP